MAHYFKYNCQFQSGAINYIPLNKTPKVHWHMILLWIYYDKEGFVVVLYYICIFQKGHDQCNLH